MNKYHFVCDEQELVGRTVLGVYEDDDELYLRLDNDTYACIEACASYDSVFVSLGTFGERQLDWHVQESLGIITASERAVFEQEEREQERKRSLASQEARDFAEYQRLKKKFEQT